ncbi:MAG: hypothetical protein KBB94_07965 [Legionellaceae bacterium]|nr:hypothetical protein [Legionellaceae bacterium]MBP9775115.1 hypothetical protein [Legionellaceae bacterium]
MLDKHNITFIGPEQSGKTQIVNRLATDNDFVEKYKLRTGALNKKKTYPEKGLQIEYTDYGPDIKAEQINSGLTKASKICLVFDATDTSAVQKLIAYLSSKGITLPAGTQLLIVGNKIDLLSQEQISDVSRAANEYAQTMGATFLAVSAKDRTHIDVLIDSLTTRLPVGLSSSSSVIPTRRASFSQRSIVSSASNRQQLGGKVAEGAVSIWDLAESSDEEHTPNKRTGAGGLPLQQRTPIRTYSPSRARLRVDAVPPADTTLSFALRLAGMALIVTAITSLIYLAIVAAGFVSAVALNGVVNQVVVTVGGLLGMSAPAAALTQFFATYGISAAAGSELLAAGASLVTLGVGYGLRRFGQKPAAANDEDVEAVVASRSTLSTALRYVGMALMVAALVNAIYLLLIATNVFSAVALTAGMNHLLVSVAGLLGFAAPVTAFGNACAAIGLSTTAATGALSATGSLLMAVTGYSMFRCNPPVRSGLPPRDESILTSGHHDGRTSPPLVEKTYRR